MQVTEAVRTSLAEIRAHKLRSALTLVGIVLGTTALVVMVSVIGGAAEAVEKGLSDLGFDGVMFVVPTETADRIERKKQGYSRGLRGADGRVIDSGREIIEGAAPVLGLGDETARLNGRTLKVMVEGVPRSGVASATGSPRSDATSSTATSRRGRRWLSSARRSRRTSSATRRRWAARS